MQVLLQIIQDVFEPGKILRHGITERLVRIEHVGVDLLFLVGPGAIYLLALELLALGGGASVRMNVEDLVEPETGEKIAAALATMDHVEMPVALFL